jgi:hypothetical protein
MLDKNRQLLSSTAAVRANNFYPERAPIGAHFLKDANGGRNPLLIDHIGTIEKTYLTQE